MSTSMSTDEKFDEVMKKCHTLTLQNEALMKKLNQSDHDNHEHKAQNEYLRKQLAGFLKQK